MSIEPQNSDDVKYLKSARRKIIMTIDYCFIPVLRIRSRISQKHMVLEFQRFMVALMNNFGGECHSR